MAQANKTHKTLLITVVLTSTSLALMKFGSGMIWWIGMLCGCIAAWPIVAWMEDGNFGYHLPKVKQRPSGGKNGMVEWVASDKPTREHSDAGEGYRQAWKPKPKPKPINTPTHDVGGEIDQLFSPRKKAAYPKHPQHNSKPTSAAPPSIGMTQGELFI